MTDYFAGVNDEHEASRVAVNEQLNKMSAERKARDAKLLDQFQREGELNRRREAITRVSSAA